MKALVVVLSNRSLFAEGVASRLQNYPDRVEVKYLAPEQSDTLEQLKALQPSVVILDATEENILHCSLNAIFAELPTLKIVRLNSQREQVQIVTSERHSASVVHELLDIIAPDSPPKK